MAGFRFVTEWSVPAAIERVWDELNRPERVPQWWPGFEHAESVSGERNQVGAVSRYRVRGSMGLVFDFTLTVAAVREPAYLLLRASGDFVGTGEWHLASAESGTTVTYVWDVEVQRPVLRWLSRLPGARAYLTRSHHRVMAEGGRNLARLLEAEASL